MTILPEVRDIPVAGVVAHREDPTEGVEMEKAYAPPVLETLPVTDTRLDIGLGISISLGGLLS
jgi:hypothetical protein